MNNEEMTKELVEEIIEEEEGLAEEEFIDLEEETPKKADTADGIIAWCDKHRKGVNRTVKILKGVGIGLATVATVGGAVVAGKAIKKHKASLEEMNNEIESWDGEVPQIEMTETADVDSSDVKVTEF